MRSKLRLNRELRRPGLVLVMLAAAYVSAGAAGASTVDPAAWPNGARNTLIRPEVEAFVDKLMAKMTLEEKVGQMIQADIDSIAPSDLHEYKLGSILAGGNAAPGHNVRAKPAEWLALTDAFARAAAAVDPGAHHTPIPILFGIDAVHGHARIPGATVFPHNVGLGAAHDADLVRRIGQATAAEVSVTGIDWTFAPTVAVVRDVRWGRSYESYSEDPQLVAAYSAAMVTGVQGQLGTPDFLGSGHTVSSVKHFLGDGGTVDGRDQFNNPATEQDLIRIHAAGYPAAIAAGVLTVMASYNAWHDVKMHANTELLTGVLKGRLGFNGFVVGDWNAQEEIPGCTKVDCAAVIRAGLDMFMAPDSWKELYKNTLREAQAGEIPRPRVDDAVRRILRVKVLAGMFDRPMPAKRPAAGDFDGLGSSAHRALAREAVRKSLVLLKNNGSTLPLNPRGRILVCGVAADDIGQQAGGWTIDWQGKDNSNTDFPGATSIFAGIKAAAAAAGGSAILSRNGQYSSKPDAAIVVFGERPYAEFQGDRETLEFSPGDKRDLGVMQRLHAAGIPVVAVFLSGRPMWVNPELNAADAFVAAWLPGSEGGGIADVLFKGAGQRPRYDFTGTLSFSWPNTVMPVTFGAIDKARGALFERGYGLSYEHPATVEKLPELAGAAADRHAPDVLFGSGRVTAPWSVYVSDAAAEVRLTTPKQASPTGAVAVSVAPEGASAVWSGRGMGSVRIGGRPADLNPELAQGRALSMRLRIDAEPAGAVRIGLRCAAPYGAAVHPDKHLPELSAAAWGNCRAKAAATFDVSRQMRAAAKGRWTVIAIPLACFAHAGADLSAVEAPFTVITDASFAFTVSDVGFAKESKASPCPDQH